MLYDLAKKKKIEWREALEDYLNLRAKRTQDKYRQVIGEFERETGKELLDVGEAEVLKYASWALKQPGRFTPSVSRAHVRSKFVILASIISYLRDLNFTQTNPIKATLKTLGRAQPGDVHPSGTLAPIEVKKLLNSQGAGVEAVRNIAIIALLFGAGLRLGEVVAIKIDHVRKTVKGNAYIHLPVTKAQKVQNQGLQSWVSVAVEKLLEQRKTEGAGPNDPLITGYYVNGKPYNKFLDNAHVAYWFKGWLRNAGISKAVTPHWGRCTAINRLLSKNVPADKVKEFSRHSSVRMVEYYERRQANLDNLVQKDLDYEDE